MKIKAAIFDMDGTLIDSLMLWDVLWKEFGRKYLSSECFNPTVEDDMAVRTLPLKEAMELLHDHYGLGESGAELLDTANKIIEDFYAHSVQLKDGVKAFLDHCYENGVKMCIASATSPELLEVALAHCGIKPYFSKIFSCSVLGKGKDTPEIYLMAQEFLGTETEETWVFEDSVVALETAAKIGMPVVGIYDRFNTNQERIKELATEYIAPGETLLKLI